MKDEQIWHWHLARRRSSLPIVCWTADYTDADTDTMPMPMPPMVMPLQILLLLTIDALLAVWVVVLFEKVVVVRLRLDDGWRAGCGWSQFVLHLLFSH